MDQEKRIAYLVKNDWSTAPVPTEYRRSNYGVVATLVGQIIALSGIYIGAGMVGGLTLTQAFIATVIGSIILAVLGGFLSWVGTKTGVGLSMLLRESFGTIGSYIVSLMLLLVAVGFFGYLRRNNSRHVSGRWLDHKPDRCRRLGRYSDDDYRLDRL